MKKYWIIVLSLFTLISCSDDKDFQVVEDEVGKVEIVSGGKDLHLAKDTAWYVSDAEGHRLCSCDEYKIAAFFNVLRDVQVMGLSNHPQDGAFDSEIILKKSSGSVIKKIRLKSVAGSSQMIGSVNGGKCYIVGVPGLNVSPITNFSAAADYWKDLSLLELTPYNISKISVENFADPAQSFFISTVADAFEIRGVDGNLFTNIPEQSIRQWLGSIAGTYRAVKYVDAEQFAPADSIFRLKVRTRLGDEESITFYKKTNDFNLMFFSKGDEKGLAKYYDFDRVLVEVAGVK
ncbi:MAG: hypothetical protein J6U21_05595 [Bacteroidales bacterium]|nr:hypothetical protein [Bacteroidales bacterium]